MRHERLEWDDHKAKSNRLKHGIRFEEAAAVLADPFGGQTHVTIYDGPHSRFEDRWTTVGSYPYERSRIFVIVWTTRVDSDGVVTRIVSARSATPRERKAYQDETSNS
jgi:uncharacterized DUF497 family protein